MKHEHVIASLFFACVLSLMTASAVSAQSRAEVSCSSEDDGHVQLILTKDANGNFAGTSAPFSLNSGLKLYVDILGLSRVIVNSRLKVAGVNITAIATATGAAQAGAGFATIFDRDGRTGISLFSLAGIRDPEGLDCLVQLR